MMYFTGLACSVSVLISLLFELVAGIDICFLGLFLQVIVSNLKITVLLKNVQKGM